MSVCALKDHVIVTLESKPLQSKGGLFLVERWANLRTVGIVHSVGSGVQDIHEGERVSLKPDAGREIDHEGQMYVVLHKSEVLLRLGEEVVVEQKVD